MPSYEAGCALRALFDVVTQPRATTRTGRKPPFTSDTSTETTELEKRRNRPCAPHTHHQPLSSMSSVHIQPSGSHGRSSPDRPRGEGGSVSSWDETSVPTNARASLRRPIGGLGGASHLLLSIQHLVPASSLRCCFFAPSSLGFASAGPSRQRSSLQARADNRSHLLHHPGSIF